MDYFAIATLGFFPTPTPSAAERMSFAASWGYLNVAGTVYKGLGHFGLGLTLT